MTTSLETVRRLQAWNAGKPLPRGEVVNVSVQDDEDVLVAAFLRMGGESRPWGIAVGSLSDGPTFFAVPEARNRQLVGDMVVQAASIFLEHFRHPRWSDSNLAAYKSDTLRQLWLPGPTHIEMLHHLAAAYARTKWEREDIDTLRALGNLSNALFIEHQRPGQQIVVSATEALRKTWVFPTAAVRQGHLGHLLAWLEDERTREDRLKSAHTAERESVATVLDPKVERSVLQPFVEKWGEARKAADAEGMSSANEKIVDVLTQELKRRWELTARSIELIRDDARGFNQGLDRLVEKSKDAFHHSWGNRVLEEDAGRQPFWPNVFTDFNARSAGAAYQRRIAQDEMSRFYLVNGDRELQQEELAAGHGVIGRVSSTGPGGLMWTVKWSYPDLPTLKEGASVCLAGYEKVKFKVEEVQLDRMEILVKPEWKRAIVDYGSNGLAPSDPKWKGRAVVLLDLPAFGLAERKASSTAKTFGEDDITNLLTNPRDRHVAYDDEGEVVELPIDEATTG